MNRVQVTDALQARSTIWSRRGCTRIPSNRKRLELLTAAERVYDIHGLYAIVGGYAKRLKARLVIHAMNLPVQQLVGKRLGQVTLRSNA